MSIYTDQDIRIEKLDEGFLFYHADKKCAVSNLDMIFKKIREAYNLPRRLPKKTTGAEELTPLSDVRRLDSEIDKILATKTEPEKPTSTIPESTTLEAIQCNVSTEIEPFKEIPFFEPETDAVVKKYLKSGCKINKSGNVRIFRDGYSSVFVHTTIAELNRLKALPEMTLKLILQEYRKRVYANKFLVLSTFLGALKPDFADSLPDKYKVIPTFSTLKQVDEIKKV